MIGSQHVVNIFVLYLILRSCGEALGQINTMNCIHEKKNDNYDVDDLEDNSDDALVDIKSDGL